MGKQVMDKARITGFIDITKPHLKKVLHREGENEVVVKEIGRVRGFNTLAIAFQKAIEEQSGRDKGIRDKALHRRRAR